MTIIKRFVDLMRNWQELVTVQESACLNPDWFWDIKLGSVKSLNILSYNNLSNILLETDSKEMRR